MDVLLRQVANDIWDSLGPGYSESVYHSAFEVALRRRDIYYDSERIIPVFYMFQNVGHVRADLIIEQKYVVELKSVSRLTETHRIQIRNYMKLLNFSNGFLINFSETGVEFQMLDAC